MGKVHLEQLSSLGRLPVAVEGRAAWWALSSFTPPPALACGPPRPLGAGRSPEAAGTGAVDTSFVGEGAGETGSAACIGIATSTTGGPDAFGSRRGPRGAAGAPGSGKLTNVGRRRWLAPSIGVLPGAGPPPSVRTSSPQAFQDGLLQPEEAEEELPSPGPPPPPSL